MFSQRKNLRFWRYDMFWANPFIISKMPRGFVDDDDDYDDDDDDSNRIQ